MTFTSSSRVSRYEPTRTGGGKNLLDLVGGVRGFGGGEAILLAIFIGDGEKVFEFSPSIKGYITFSLLLTVVIEQTSGFDVVIAPANELAIVDDFITLFGKVVHHVAVQSEMQLVSGGFPWSPHKDFVLSLVSIIDISVSFPNVLHELIGSHYLLTHSLFCHV